MIEGQRTGNQLYKQPNDELRNGGILQYKKFFTDL